MISRYSCIHATITKSRKFTTFLTELNAEFEHDFDDEKICTNRKRPPPKVSLENQFSWIASKVNPFITMPYCEQLRWKYQAHRDILLQLADIGRLSDRKNRRLLPIEYDGVIPSPRIYGYRNKDNFHVGIGVDGNSRTVGQVVGSSSRQEVFTVSTELLVSSPLRHKQVLKAVQQFVGTVELPRSAQTSKKFAWIDGFIRSNKQGDVALAFCLNPKGLTKDEQEDQIKKCAHFFKHGLGADASINSLYVKKSPFSCYGRESFELILGQEYLEETLLNRYFHISPDSFFQVNTHGAEILYQTVREFATMTSPLLSFSSLSSTLLDACCGTGTIGVLLADRFQNVIGFDIEQTAVENARANAKRNGLKNAYYYKGPAKSCLKYMKSRGVIGNKYMIAVVNPSRSGLSNSVMKELRGIPEIKRIVYVSCNPGGRCLNNFELLCRKPRQYSIDFAATLTNDSHDANSPLVGRPFMPVRAVSVDMFPHTHHCEMVIAFDRQEE